MRKNVIVCVNILHVKRVHFNTTKIKLVLEHLSEKVMSPKLNSSYFSICPLSFVLKDPQILLNNLSHDSNAKFQIKMKLLKNTYSLATIKCMFLDNGSVYSSSGLDTVASECVQLVLIAIIYQMCQQDMLFLLCSNRDACIR